MVVKARHDERTTPACPICGETVIPEVRLKHWSNHVDTVETGNGEMGYTWRCACGPAAAYWGAVGAAALGAARHMERQHGIAAS